MVNKEKNGIKEKIDALNEIRKMEENSLIRLVKIMESEKLDKDLQIEFRKIEVMEDDIDDSDGYYQEPNIPPADSPHGLSLVMSQN